MWYILYIWVEWFSSKYFQTACYKQKIPWEINTSKCVYKCKQTPSGDALNVSLTDSWTSQHSYIREYKWFLWWGRGRGLNSNWKFPLIWLVFTPVFGQILYYRSDDTSVVIKWLSLSLSVLCSFQFVMFFPSMTFLQLNYIQKE